MCEGGCSVCRRSPTGKHGTYSQARKGHTNFRKALGHWPGVPGTPGGTNRGLPAGVPRTACLSFEKLTEKGIFAGRPAGCPGTPGRPAVFRKKFYVIFSYVPLLPSIQGSLGPFLRLWAQA